MELCWKDWSKLEDYWGSAVTLKSLLVFINQDIRLLVNVVFGLETLSLDPWFSSLWTLQELVIRPDAALMYREGVPSTATAGELTFNVRAVDLTNMCQHLVGDLVISLFL